ncbi:MAG: hypothetical protein QNJ91_12235, partial [Gammaproteobacteria bacterium]|nr:hypothetical protein [Gammaproteobacteria bacterium]
MKALGGAHPPFFSLLAQRKEGKRKGTLKAWSPLRSDCPALLAVSGARELAIADRSDMHALFPGNGC